MLSVLDTFLKEETEKANKIEALRILRQSLPPSAIPHLPDVEVEKKRVTQYYKRIETYRSTNNARNN